MPKKIPLYHTSRLLNGICGIPLTLVPESISNKIFDLNHPRPLIFGIFRFIHCFYFLILLSWHFGFFLSLTRQITHFFHSITSASSWPPRISIDDRHVLTKSSTCWGGGISKLNSINLEIETGMPPYEWRQEMTGWSTSWLSVLALAGRTDSLEYLNHQYNWSSPKLLRMCKNMNPKSIFILFLPFSLLLPVLFKVKKYWPQETDRQTEDAICILSCAHAGVESFHLI